VGAGEPWSLTIGPTYLKFGVNLSVTINRRHDAERAERAQVDQSPANLVESEFEFSNPFFVDHGHDLGGIMEPDLMRELLADRQGRSETAELLL
jgi:hypothetical protein